MSGQRLASTARKRAAASSRTPPHAERAFLRFTSNDSRFTLTAFDHFNVRPRNDGRSAIGKSDFQDAHFTLCRNLLEL